MIIKNSKYNDLRHERLSSYLEVVWVWVFSITSVESVEHISFLWMVARRPLKFKMKDIWTCVEHNGSTHKWIHICNFIDFTHSPLLTVWVYFLGSMLPHQDSEHDPIAPKLLPAAEFGRQCFVPVFVQISLDAFLRRIGTAQHVFLFDRNSVPTLTLTLENNEKIIWIHRKNGYYKFYIKLFKMNLRLPEKSLPYWLHVLVFLTMVAIVLLVENF